MKTEVDNHKRVVLPGAEPGDIYDVREEGEGCYLLTRLQRTTPKDETSREDCLRAMNEHAVCFHDEQEAPVVFHLRDVMIRTLLLFYPKVQVGPTT